MSYITFILDPLKAVFSIIYSFIAPGSSLGLVCSLRPYRRRHQAAPVSVLTGSTSWS
jgi:hypothetical protein